MKKLSKKAKMIILTTIMIIIVTIGIIISANIIKVNIANEKYKSSNGGSNNEKLLPEYIKIGVTIAGVTGTLESLNTFDATATPEDIVWGETAYVKGEKITGTKILTVAQAKESQYVFSKDETLIDDYKNNVKVPAGFKIADDSATSVEDGVVIEDNNGNQFVWIPANTSTGATINLSNGGNKTLKYQRTDFGKQVFVNYSNCYETMPTDEEKSINENGGYYIGRYEAGDSESVDSNGKKVMRTSSSPQNHKAVVKKDQVPYLYITISNAKSLAEGFGTTQGYSTVKTKLISSYAWDTAVNFLQIKNSDYGTSSIEGNYYDTEFYYADFDQTEKSSYKSKNVGQLIPTGKTTSVSNIYDMGGNAYEWTSEMCSNSTSGSYIHRGGGFDQNKNACGYNNTPSGFRQAYTGAIADTVGFRISLFFDVN